MKARIAEIIQSIRPEIEFDDNLDAHLYGVLDSLDIIMLVEEIENKLGIIIDADDIIPENFSSLHILAAVLQRKVQ